jgi:hypothetical protein
LVPAAEWKKTALALTRRGINDGTMPALVNLDSLAGAGNVEEHPFHRNVAEAVSAVREDVSRRTVNEIPIIGGRTRSHLQDRVPGHNGELAIGAVLRFIAEKMPFVIERRPAELVIAPVHGVVDRIGGLVGAN